MSDFTIEIIGLDKVQKALDKFPRQIMSYMQHAGKESARVILAVRGLKSYPPSGPGNRPPLPYYVRGIGTQYQGYNAGNSEQYGKRWDVSSEGYGTRIGNDASYAKYIGGEDQAHAMEMIGWRRLIDVARNKLADIKKIYQLWTDKLIHDLGL